MLENFILYLAFGSLAGLLSGLFGIGGGVVLVPFLAWQFSRQGFSPETIMIMAIATSLATIVMTSLSAIYSHHRLGSVHWPTVRRLSPGIMAGTMLGSIVAERLPVHALKLIFSLFLLLIAVRMLSGGKQDDKTPWRPSRWLLAAAGLAIGALSAILGIGGGTMSVPLLSRLKFSMRAAVANSSACGFPIAVAGSASYIALGWQLPELPPYCLGYIYVPAVAGIVVTSVLFAPAGARLAHRLPTARLKRLFALVIFAIGGRMLWQSTSS
ncbi:MAG: putative rane protein [Proteobacteria bacterium]|nr:putative rane protein [Pseudomonadota bacterium]